MYVAKTGLIVGALIATLFVVVLSSIPSGYAAKTASPSNNGKIQSGASRAEVQPEQVILFVLEGVGKDSLKTGAMPVLSRLVKDGSVTWSAAAVTPALRLPTMASLFTGMPVEKHGITWNAFDFIRGYPRPPTVFDYLDLSGGKDSAIFFMDESLYQLAKPEPYTDYQMCGPLKPECSPAMLVNYIRQYFKKATSGHGYGHAILSLPHFLVVHLPEPTRAGEADGWNSKGYREALKTVDAAMGSVLDLYKELGLLEHTTILVTSLSGMGKADLKKRLNRPPRAFLAYCGWHPAPASRPVTPSHSRSRFWIPARRCCARLDSTPIPSGIVVRLKKFFVHLEPPLQSRL